MSDPPSVSWAIQQKIQEGWYNEYQQKLDLPTGYAGREPKFSQEQKAAAIEHYLTHDRCISATMRALGYLGRGTLTAWFARPFLGQEGPSLAVWVDEGIPGS